MRNTGWSKFGYYPTPPRVTDMVAKKANRWMYWKRPETDARPACRESRVMDPCCGEGTAAARFAELLEARARENTPAAVDVRVATYGIEVEQERASEARKQFTQVWHADIDAMRMTPSSYDYLWLNPPYDWADSGDGGASRLESRFLHQCTWGLKADGTLIYIVPRHVLRWDAGFLTEHYHGINVWRFPDPEYDDYGQVAVVATKRTRPRMGGDRDVAEKLVHLAKPDSDIAVLDSTGGMTIPKETSQGNHGWPGRRMWFRPADVVDALGAEGIWNTREMRDRLSTEFSRARMRPIERLHEGHAAMVAANSMMDNVIIRDPDNEGDPIVLRGFFKKVSRETQADETHVVKTDYFESNIRAMNTRTGQIQEMGSDPEGLAAFMETYGRAIREHIDVAYPAAVDPESEECRRIAERISALHRPLIGKQIEATMIGAAYLKHNPHLNLYFEPGTGKTCCSFAVAFGMEASKIAVMTPSRVVRNWVDEILKVWPDSYIRIIDNQKPIGNRRPTSEQELAWQPARVDRCSLEEARRMEAWASPDTPLWIILKKDTARRTYPTRHGLRLVGVATMDADPRNLPGQRPLAGMAKLENRIGRNRRNGRSGSSMQERSLYRDGTGALCKWPDELPAEGTCPQCWHPLTLEPKWRSNDRDALCISERPVRRYPMNEELLGRLRDEEREAGAQTRGKYGGTWWPMGTREERAEASADAGRAALESVAAMRTLRAERARYQGPDVSDEGEIILEQPETCSAPIATAIRDEAGRAYYSYGDYLAKYMGHWLDLFIVDEVQDYKAKETAQGETTRRIAQHAKKTMALTGTPFGGKVSEVFFLLLALNPGFGEAFGYRDVGSFRRLYGREETIYKVQEDERSRSVGTSSRRRETKQSTREIPGYHPALLEFFWHNTLFMALQDVDVDGLLPPIRHRANLIPLDTTEQTGTTEQLSHQQAYEYLDREMTKHIRQELQRGSKRSLGLYLQEMLTYPENAWKGTAPRDPETGKVIVEIDPMSDAMMYPKERVLMSLVRDQVRQKRKCLIYCTHTGRRDTTTRLMNLLRMEGVRALQLKAGTVDSEERSEWLQREAQRNDVIICQPKLVETGVNLLDYPTIIWFEIEYSMFLTEQASRRSYRLNQTVPVEIFYLAYAQTMQERALQIIARKADVSRTFHGDLSKTGLSAFNPDPDDIREQLAREMAQGSHLSEGQSDALDINELLKSLDSGDMPEAAEIDERRLSLPITRRPTRRFAEDQGEQIALAF